MSNFLSSLYILKISPLSDLELVKIFSHSVGCLLSYWLCPLLYRCFSDSVGLSYLLLHSCKWCWCYIYIWEVVSYAHGLNANSNLFFYQVHLVGFILRSLIHLDSSFVCGSIYGSICILSHADIQLCQHHLLMMLSFIYCIILGFLSKSGDHRYVD